MTASPARDTLSFPLLLRLLLGTTLAPDDPFLLDGPALEQVLHWAVATRKPGRTGDRLDLSDAPLEPHVRDALPGRSGRLRAALDIWNRDGIWVLGRDEPGFPRRLRRRMGAETPPLLFGRGDRALPGRGGVALLLGEGGDPGLADTVRDALARAGISGIACDGDAIRITRPEPRADAELGLSPPGTVPSDAAGVRTCAHALADAVVVSGLRRADPAWPSIVALIARDRQPVWVAGQDGDSALLLRAGAWPLPPALLRDGDAAALLRPPPSPQARSLLRGPVEGSERLPGPEPVRGFAEQQAGFGAPDGVAAATTRRAPFLRLVQADTAPRPAQTASVEPQTASQPTLFELFGMRLRRLLAQGPLGAGRIAEAMDLTRSQVDAWLLRALAEGTVTTDPQTRLYAGADG